MAIASSGTAATAAGAAPPSPNGRRTLAVATGAHALHDGYTDLITVLLPVWQAEFGLAYAAVGLLRTIYSGTMACFQIPSSILAERIGGAGVLAAGTALAAGCFCLAGASAGFPWLVAALVIGGLGASTQHPIGSALVAHAFAGPRSVTALGTYNFSGDIGKVLVPAAASLMLLGLAWRPVVAILGGIGFAAAIAIFILTPRLPSEHDKSRNEAEPQRAAAAPDAPLRSGFMLLLAIGSIDSATRTGFLVFLPFLMIQKGATVTTAGLALTLVFLGGAAGKLLCAYLGRWFGAVATIAVTKIVTAAGIALLLVLPIGGALAVLVPFGAMLNGASSVTYGSVPEFVTPANRARAFGLFYTGTIGAGAVAPTLSGVIGDALGIPTTLMIIAAAMLLSLPLAFMLRSAFADRDAA